MNTENVHLAALAMCRGARLNSVVVSRSNGGRNTAVFELEAADGDAIAREFYGCEALVNLSQYREHLSQLKDRIADDRPDDDSRPDPEEKP